MSFVPRLPSREVMTRASTLALIGANIVPLLGVLLLHWDLGEVVLLFWAENVVIGLYHAAKLWVVARGLGKAIVPFFLFHYGMFTLVHGVFVIALFVHAVPPIPTFALAIGALVVSHGVSFVQNFLRGAEADRWREKGANALMGAAYGRIVVLHLTIIFGAFLMQALGSPVWALALLVVLKTSVDLGAHAAQRHSASLQPRPIA